MIPFEETLRPRFPIRLIGSNQLYYRIDEEGLQVRYRRAGGDSSSSLGIPAGDITGASVVWTREDGYDVRENPRRTLALVRWLYYWMPYADPITGLVEVRTGDGTELFGTARPEAFVTAVGTVLGGVSTGGGDGSPPADVPGPGDS